MSLFKYNNNYNNNNDFEKQSYVTCIHLSIDIIVIPLNIYMHLTHRTRDNYLPI